MQFNCVGYVSWEKGAKGNKYKFSGYYDTKHRNSVKNSDNLARVLTRNKFTKLSIFI